MEDNMFKYELNSTKVINTGQLENLDQSKTATHPNL